MTDTRFVEYRHTWERKPSLRAIYHDLYEQMIAQLAPGLVLEVGGGSGNLRRYLNREVISTDIGFQPWLHAVADAQQMPFRDNVFGNIVMFDVLHHLERPIQFFREAARVLRCGGRVLMVEPAMTPLSTMFYRHFHPEPVNFHVDPLEDGPRTPGRDAMDDANQAIPSLLFLRDKSSFSEQVPELRVTLTRLTSLFAYPLSGGFRKWTLLPTPLIPRLLALEKILEPTLGPAMAFRLLIVIEKSTTHQNNLTDCGPADDV